MKFHVPDMSCNHCVASVTKAIKALSADALVVCDLQNRVVDVSNIEQKNPADIIATLDEVGYDATLIQANV